MKAVTVKNINTYEFLTFKQLPKAFQIKALTSKLFRVNDGVYSKSSYRVTRYNFCKKCRHHQGTNPKAKTCSCGEPYTHKYFITTCNKVSSFYCHDPMCGIHPKSSRHSPVCVCDECM